MEVGCRCRVVDDLDAGIDEYVERCLAGGEDLRIDLGLRGCERALRRELCDFVRRGYKQRLLISSQGTFSARVEGDEFLMTPARSRPPDG